MVLTNDRTFQMRVTGEFLRQIDDWRRHQPDLPSRSEAIRRLTDLGLQVDDKTPGAIAVTEAGDLRR